jgi:hypothetical protein
VQAAIAYRISQRFYPVRYEYARMTRTVGAALLAYLAASALPPMPSWAGLSLRGSTVILVMGGVLVLTGFFNREELRALDALRRRHAGQPGTAAPDTTEFAGEIVAVDLPDEAVRALDRAKR